MRLWRIVALSLVLSASASDLSARAQEADLTAAYLVAYVEVMPTSTMEAATLLRQYRDASRRDPGNLQFEVLQQAGRPDHFAVVEVWSDEKAMEAHQQADHRRQFRDAVEGLRVSPYDERLYAGMVVGPATSATAADAIYVLTHADAVPTGKDVAVDLLTGLAGASRQADGNVRFDVLQQASRQNHFTLVEAWNDQRALEAHAMSSRTRQFRDAFQALSGALWDERLYRVVD